MKYFNLVLILSVLFIFSSCEKDTLLPIEDTPIGENSKLTVPSGKSVDAGILSYAFSGEKSANSTNVQVENSNGVTTDYSYESSSNDDWEVNYGEANIKFRSGNNTVTYSYGADIITVVDMNNMSYDNITDLNSLGNKALDEMEESVLVTHDLATDEVIVVYSNGSDDGSGVSAKSPMCVDWSRSRCQEAFEEQIMLPLDCNITMDCLCGAGDYFCICTFQGCD